MKKFISIFDKKFYFICFAALSCISLFNAASLAGIWSDGVYWLCEFFDKNIHLDHGRLFTHIILHLPDFLLKSLSVTNLNMLVFLHGFWAYLSTVICLAAAYKVLPSEKKEWFVFPLLSYLICMIFSSYYIFNDSHLAAGLFWIIFSIYFFADFTKLSNTDLTILLTACFIFIRTYQSTLFFVPLLLTTGTIKFFKAKKDLSSNTSFLLLLSFALLAASFIFGFYYTANPTQYKLSEYTNSFNALSSMHFTLFFWLFILTMMKKEIYAEITVFCLFAYVMFSFVVKSNLIVIYANNMRILNLLVPLFSALFLVYLKSSTIKINFKKFKAVIFLLLIVFTANSFLFSAKINTYFKIMADYLKTVSGTVKVQDFTAYLPEKYKFLTKIDENSLFEQSIIVQILYNKSGTVDSVILADAASLENYRIDRYENIINKLNKNSNIKLR